MPWTKAHDRPEYHTTKWRRARAAALKAANNRCQANLPGCTNTATQVDHIHGIANDPDHQHLQAVCVPCHHKITAQQGGGFRSKTKPDPPAQPRTQW